MRCSSLISFWSIFPVLVYIKVSKKNNLLFADDNNLYGEVSEENYDLDLNNIETWMAAKKTYYEPRSNQNHCFQFKLKKPLITF